MNGKVTELFSRTLIRNAHDEIGRQCSVSSCAGNVVHAILRKDDVASKKSNSLRRLDDTCGDDSTMLIPITGKQVSHEAMKLWIHRLIAPRGACPSDFF
jgi:hypothetical protein